MSCRECNWCSTDFSFWAGGDNDDEDSKATHWRDLSYPAIASLSYFFASLYSAGIPMLFFGIMYSNRARLRTQRFNKAYGFLTSKTSEKYYWWECGASACCSWCALAVAKAMRLLHAAIIVRKLMLSLITKHSVDTTDGTSSIRNPSIQSRNAVVDLELRLSCLILGAGQTLCNVAVVLVACTAHVYARPFAHTGEDSVCPLVELCLELFNASSCAPDANIAEMATLFATMLTLLVGMGTIKVQDEAGNTVNDPGKQTARLSEAEKGVFYVIICESSLVLSDIVVVLSCPCACASDIAMGLFCLMSLGIIVRRLGGVALQVQRGNQRPFKP